MGTLKSFLLYLVWPNPGNASYGNPKYQALLIGCGLLILLSITFSLWRRSTKNPVTKRLTRSWPSASLWFGIIGFILAVSRVEGVSFLSMRLWWVFWGLAVGLYVYVQVRLFRARYYQPLPREYTEDPREKYLPRRKK